ncbi:MAG TPA: hypothetical protein VK126_00695 [Nitrososphaerales archaeon]|nr:hypothetical protein [Nitrososphaerales archaeon]
MSGASQTGVPQEEEVQISYLRSKDGKTKTIPVWFTVNEGKLELMPMYGLKTKWFADVEKGGTIDLKIREWRRKASKPKILRDSKVIDDIKRRFSVKYGEGHVKRYYPSQDVALEIPL